MLTNRVHSTMCVLVVQASIITYLRTNSMKVWLDRSISLWKSLIIESLYPLRDSRCLKTFARLYSVSCLYLLFCVSPQVPPITPSPEVSVALAGCWSRSIGPTTTLSKVGAPGASVTTAKMIPLLPNIAEITDEFVSVSKGTVMLLTPWKKTA